MSDLTVDILCFLYVTLLVFIGFILNKYCHMKSEGVRKFIHIFTSFIIIACEKCVSAALYRLAVPFLFIFINIFAVSTDMIKDLGMKDKERNIGLILYPMAVFLVVLMETLGLIGKESAVAGVLMMGLGDGLAALIGMRYGKHVFFVYGKAKRSLEGCFTMAVVSSAITLLFSGFTVLPAVLVGIAASLIEAFSPPSLDNISVPVLSALLVELLTRLS